MNTQIYGYFEFNRTIGSDTQTIEPTALSQRTDQSQRSMHTHVRKQNGRSLENLQIGISSINSAAHTQTIKMDKVNGIEMEFIIKNRGYSPEPHRLNIEQNGILKPEKLRIVESDG